MHAQVAIILNYHFIIIGVIDAPMQHDGIDTIPVWDTGIGSRPTDTSALRAHQTMKGRVTARTVLYIKLVTRKYFIETTNDRCPS